MKVPFDYWSWFRTVVKTLNIAPSEAWKLDLIDILQLLEDGSTKDDIDLSMMLKFERKQNGWVK